MISGGYIGMAEQDTQSRIFKKVKARVRFESKQMVKVASLAVFLWWWYMVP